jgi:hypothetical protein
MPRRPGLDVLRALSERQLASRVIIISGTPPTSLDDISYVDGCNVIAVLAKPATSQHRDVHVERKSGEEGTLGDSIITTPTRWHEPPVYQSPLCADFVVEVADEAVRSVRPGYLTAASNH